MYMKRIIQRPAYLNRLIAVKNTQDIKVITGVRRCGKSVLLKQMCDYIQKTEPTANLVVINLQEMEYESLLEYHALYSYILSKHQKRRHNYLMIDEVQLCENFEKAINSLHAKELFDIYVTGSNAFLLSSDLATLFTGRVFTVEVYPFSFAEYMDYFKLKNTDAGFETYSLIGGFPGAYQYSSENNQYDYLDRDVYQTIVVRDLVKKYRIRNVPLLESITAYMMDNTANLISASSITDYLNSAHIEVTYKTVSKYIGYLCSAYVFYKADRYDLKGKRYLKTDSKYYLCDPALRYAVLGRRNLDYGRVYENIVYIELLRRGYQVYVGKLYQKEIDFVASNRDIKIYIQVSSYVEDAKVLERETAPLLAIRDAYPKMIIARTHHEPYGHMGIQIVDISDWLANIQKL